MPIGPSREQATLKARHTIKNTYQQVIGFAAFSPPAGLLLNELGGEGLISGRSHPRHGKGCSRRLPDCLQGDGAAHKAAEGPGDQLGAGNEARNRPNCKVEGHRGGAHENQSRGKRGDPDEPSPPRPERGLSNGIYHLQNERKGGSDGGSGDDSSPRTEEGH